MRDGALKGASKGIPDTKCRVASWLLLASTFAIFAVILSRNYWPDQPYLSDTSLNATNSALSSQAAASGSETSPSQVEQDEFDNSGAGVPPEEPDHNEHSGLAPESSPEVQKPAKESRTGSEPRTGEDEGSSNIPSWITRAADWKKSLNSVLTRDGDFLDDVQSLWRGRKRMHQRLLQGSVWWSDRAEQIVTSLLEKNQFPEDCSQRPWLAHIEHDADVVSDVHMFQPALLMGLMKGWTVVPIAGRKNIAFDGCGGEENMHLGCFFNISGCRFEDHPAHRQSLQNLNHTYREWDTVFQMEEPPSNNAKVTVIKAMRYQSSSKLYVQGLRLLKQKLWTEMAKEGTVGVYGKSMNLEGRDGQLRDVTSNQIEFMFFSILSSWMLRRTGPSVQRVANEIMLKYSMMAGEPAWSSPVLVVHMPQSPDFLKQLDPYFKRPSKSWKARDYVKEIREIEAESSFRWPTIFVFSESATALQRFAKRMNGRTTTPDSENTRFGKRFIMYDWTMNISAIENTYGGYSNMPPTVRHRLQVHRLASLYIISNIGDYAILSYESQVGRFVYETMAAQHRIAQIGSTRGPVAFSLDVGWHHD